MKELISVIVPLNNVEKYLDRCVNSIVNQTYRNIEILLIDDGSKDNSSKICDMWAQEDSRIRTFHRNCDGVSSARNFGLEIAKGELVSFVDADDFVDERYLEILYSTMQENNSDISAINYQKFWEDSIIKTEYSNEVEVLSSKMSIEAILDDRLFTNYLWNKLYKRELFDNISFPIGRIMEDLGTTYKLVARSNSVAYNKSVLYFYYQRNTSLVHAAGKKKMVDMYELAEERFNYINDLYPNNYKNYKTIMHLRMESHQYLTGKEQDESRKFVKEIWKSISKEAPTKVKIKYCMFMISPRLCRIMLNIQQSKEMLQERIMQR